MTMQLAFPSLEELKSALPDNKYIQYLEDLSDERRLLDFILLLKEAHESIDQKDLELFI